MQVGSQSCQGVLFGRGLFEVIEPKYDEPRIHRRLLSALRATAVHDEHAGGCCVCLCCLLNLFGDCRADRAAHRPADTDRIDSQISQQVLEFRSISDDVDFLSLQLRFDFGCEAGQRLQ